MSRQVEHVCLGLLQKNKDIDWELAELRQRVESLKQQKAVKLAKFTSLSTNVQKLEAEVEQDKNELKELATKKDAMITRKYEQLLLNKATNVQWDICGNNDQVLKGTVGINPFSFNLADDSEQDICEKLWEAASK